ncbi:MAG: hypothetical protein CMP28_13440, partial [Roseibacillus sp.]|nr:hypothetical protein [Roseibacillus sp.]
MKPFHHPGLLAALLLLPLHAGLAALTPITAVVTKTISVPGFPGTEPSHTTVSNYGHKPSVILTANADNSSNVAFLNASGTGISILSLSVAGDRGQIGLTGRIDPVVLRRATQLLGFTRIPSDGSFAIAYAKDSATSGADYEYWISRVSSTGATLFSTLVFGSMDQAEVESKGQPGWFSSGRLAFNPTTQRLIAYTGHSLRWVDNVRHQAGYVATVSLMGELSVVTDLLSDWYVGHNFDQRLLVDGNNFYTLAHGDAYPRALVFGRWQDGAGGTSFVGDTEYFPIRGAIGDNTTETQTGGMVKLANGNFGVVYTTKISRNNYDICYIEITPAGVAGTPTWLTSYPSNTFAIYPRIARYGDAAAIFWEEVQGGTVRAVRTKLVGTAEANATAMGTVSNSAVRLPAVYDIASLPDGGILWASTRSAGSLVLQRVVDPGILSLSSQSSNADTSGGTFTFTVSSSNSWSWSDNADWLTSNEPTSQSGNQDFSYSVSPNTSTQSRTATITITVGNLTRTHTVSQPGNETANAQQYTGDGIPSPIEEEIRWLLNRGRFDSSAENAVQGTSYSDIPATSSALAPNQQLTLASRHHSEDMARNNAYQHETVPGSAYYNAVSQPTPWDRWEAEGYDGSGGENLAAGYPGAQEAYVGWWKSTGHRVNMYNAGHREIGNGHFEWRSSTYRNYYTMAVASSGNLSFLTGTLFRDGNGNGRYEPSEAAAGITIRLIVDDIPHPYYDVSTVVGSFAIPIQSIPAGSRVEVILSSTANRAIALTIPTAYSAYSRVNLPPGQGITYGGFTRSTGVHNVGLREITPFSGLAISPAATSIPAIGGNGTFAVSSNTSWSWSDNADWLTSNEPTSQSGNQTFTYSVAPNTS